MEDLLKLNDAIKHFEDKLNAQGHIKNARDVEHLERLKDVRTDMYLTLFNN